MLSRQIRELPENFIGSISRELSKPSIPENMQKAGNEPTLSILDREFNSIRDANKKEVDCEKGDSYSLTKIEEKVKKGRKKQNSTGIPSLRPIWIPGTNSEPRCSSANSDFLS